jgi:hypothetical protein
MRVVEERVSSGESKLFDLEEFLGRPLFAHLATLSEHGPRHSPVWFYWDGKHIWIIGGTTFPRNIEKEPMCAVGIIDFNRTNGPVHHVGMRGTAVVLPFDAKMVQLIYGEYFGNCEGGLGQKIRNQLERR